MENKITVENCNEIQLADNQKPASDMTSKEQRINSWEVVFDLCKQEGMEYTEGLTALQEVVDFILKKD